MKRRGWTLLVGVLAIAPAGCMTVLKMPPHSPEQLKGVSGITTSVEIEVWESRAKRENVRMSEWSAEAREHVIAAVAKTFSTEGGVVTVSDARPSVPWHPDTYATVDPQFTIPDCELAGDAAGPEARLEVVAIQTVRSGGQRAFMSAAGSIYPPAWLFMPFAPSFWAGYYYGAGVTAVRFCLFQPGTSVPAWAYGEWFHGGLDLRNPTNAQQLVQRAHEHYRAALAKRRGALR